MKEKLLQLVELDQKIKQAKKLFDELKAELLPDLGLEAISVGDYLITKTKRTTASLSDDADVEKLKKAYPQYTKFDVSKFAKENKTTALAFTDTKTTESVRISRKK